MPSTKRCKVRVSKKCMGITNRARKFLQERDKVICSVIFRGRENAHVDEGFKLVKRLVTELEDVSKVEQPAAMHGRRIVLILAPK